jgi:hypothetical protein
MRIGIVSTVAAAALSLSMTGVMAQSSQSGSQGSSPGMSTQPMRPPSAGQGTAPQTGGGMTSPAERQPSTGATGPSQRSSGAPAAGAPESTGATSAAPTLTTQQQTQIRQSITSAKVQPLPSVSFSVSTGTVIPTDVRLHELPPTVVEVVPAYRTYRFFVVGNDIVIVEPGSRRIVQVIRNAA